MPFEHVFLALEKQSINGDLGLVVLLFEFLPLVLDNMTMSEVCSRRDQEDRLIQYLGHYRRISLRIFMKEDSIQLPEECLPPAKCQEPIEGAMLTHILD
jgi:hypothetical protein